MSDENFFALWFLVHNDPQPYRIFVPRDLDICTLKNQIQKETGAFSNFHFSKLVLWLVRVYFWACVSTSDYLAS